MCKEKGDQGLRQELQPAKTEEVREADGRKERRKWVVTDVKWSGSTSRMKSHFFQSCFEKSIRTRIQNPDVWEVVMQPLGGEESPLRAHRLRTWT